MTERRDKMIDLHRSRAFTIIELMVAVVVIIILLSLLIVALTQSQRTAQRVSTQALMRSISQALIQFEKDVGYLPPVLNNDRTLIEPPSLNSPPNFDNEIQDWYSTTTLAEYLIGYSNAQQDGFGAASDPTLPWPGIRDPGSDGVWGSASTGTFASRNPPTLGKVFGPYLELDNPRLLVAIDNSVFPPRILYPGDPGYNDPQNPKSIADYWGQPLRFYRKAYPRQAIKQSYRPVDRDGDGVIDSVPTLSDVILLRPQQTRIGGAVENAQTFGGEPIGLTTTELQAGEYALFSAGPDQQFNAQSRIDTPGTPGNQAGREYTNADNIVEVK